MSDAGWTKFEILETNNELHRTLLAVGLDDVIDFYITPDHAGGYEAVLEIREDSMMIQKYYFNTIEEAKELIAERYPAEAEDAGWD